MTAVMAGDRTALEVLVRRHQGPLLGFFFRMLDGDRAAGRRVPLTPYCVTSSHGPAVLVEQATEAVAALHRPGRRSGQRDHLGVAIGRTLAEALVGPCLVVVI